MRGYQLAEALREIAADTRNEENAARLREAAAEIERLIEEVKTLQRDWDASN